MKLRVFRLVLLQYYDCPNFLCLLPPTYQIDVCTARCLEQFKLSDNCICSLFARQAESSIKTISAAYSDNIKKLSQSLRIQVKIFSLMVTLETND